MFMVIFTWTGAADVGCEKVTGIDIGGLYGAKRDRTSSPKEAEMPLGLGAPGLARAVQSNGPGVGPER